jgi:hypothetical protein
MQHIKNNRAMYHLSSNTDSKVNRTRMYSETMRITQPIQQIQLVYKTGII